MSTSIKTICVFLLSMPLTSLVQAAYIDFTDNYWAGVQNQNTFTQDGITLQSSSGTVMTFNSSSSERKGCMDAKNNYFTGLACHGDGIGLNDDEITGTSKQYLTVTFAETVNVIQIELLDLFPKEGSNGEPEVAIISVLLDQSFSNTTYSFGGYLATGFQSNGVTTIQFSAAKDNWSDYALASITTSASVPEPASIALLAIGLIGLGAARRRIS